MDDDSDELVIVGWGLAGCTLAWQFYQNGQKFSVYDSGKNECSRIAAGLVNPVVFKRLTLSWNAPALMPYAEKFYAGVEGFLNEKIIHQRSIYAAFSGIADENDWSAKQGDPAFKPFLGDAEMKSIPHVKAPFGFGKVNTFGYLDTGVYLDASKRFFEAKGMPFIHTRFDHEIVKQDQNRHYFFCEGAEVKHNPFFGKLPFKPTHGEVLTVRAEKLKFDQVLNKNMFVLPLGNDLYKIGSTYKWDLDEPVTTQAGKQEILKKFEDLVDCDYVLVDHKAGIRPTVSGRRPLLGTHPTRRNAHLFNGLGTKGVMIAPYYADQLRKSVFEGAQLDAEVDVIRFKSLL
jgi:glycine oxidase